MAQLGIDPVLEPIRLVQFSGQVRKNDIFRMFFDNLFQYSSFIKKLHSERNKTKEVILTSHDVKQQVIVMRKTEYLKLNKSCPKPLESHLPIKHRGF